MMEYEDGGAPAVFGYPECPERVFPPAGYLKNQTLNCQFAILQGRRDYQEDVITCNLDFKVPLLGNTSFSLFSLVFEVSLYRILD